MLPASTVWLSPDLDRIMHRAIIILLIILVNRCLWFHCLTKLSLSGSEIFQLKNLVKDFSYDIYTFVLLFWQFLLHFWYRGRCVSFLGFSSYNRIYSVALFVLVKSVSVIRSNFRMLLFHEASIVSKNNCLLEA